MRRLLEITGENRLAAYLVHSHATFGDGWETLYRVPVEAGNAKPSLIIGVERLDRLNPRIVAAQRATAMLQIAFWRSLIYIGPYSSGVQAGCGYCLVLRVRQSDGVNFPEKDQTALSCIREPIFSPSGLNVVKQLLAAELQLMLESKSPRTSLGTLIVDVQHGRISFEPLLPSSQCPVCGVPEPKSTVPAFSKEGDAGELLPSRGFRRADAQSLTARLTSLYLHRHTGLLKEVLYDLQSPFAACTLELNLANRKEYVLGRSLSFDKSRSIAVLEAVERFCGMRQPAANRVVTAPFEAVAERAINPISLALYPEASYDSPSFPCQRFAPTVMSDWVSAYSLCHFREVLIPASVAFYGHKQSHGKPFLIDSSNGCAVGASLEEAALHGLFEVVERDAFLLAWYRKLSLVEIDLEEVDDQEVRMLLRKAEMVSNCDYRVFRSTMEHGIPSVVVVAVSRQRTGPQIMASGGAHLQLARAVKSALYEVIGVVMRLRHQYENKAERAYRLFQDSSLVRTIEDHPLANSVPQARARFSFLLDAGVRKISWKEACNDDPQLFSNRAHDVLGAVIGMLQRVGLEMIVVNQAYSEAVAGGLHCVKTIVPGMLPMTFGHVFRRVNLPRLIAPKRCGYEALLPKSEEPGLVPHPFP